MTQWFGYKCAQNVATLLFNGAGLVKPANPMISCSAARQDGLHLALDCTYVESKTWSTNVLNPGPVTALNPQHFFRVSTLLVNYAYCKLGALLIFPVSPSTGDVPAHTLTLRRYHSNHSNHSK